MKYEINDEIITAAGTHTVVAVIHYEGACDDSINLYVGRHADGHCDLVATDNASSWLVGSSDDEQLNRDQFGLLGSRVDVDAIRAVDAGLADWIDYCKRKAAATPPVLQYTLAFTREHCSVQRAMLISADEFDEDLRAELEGDYEIYERMTLDDLAEAVACRRGNNAFWRGAELAETYIEDARA